MVHATFIWFHSLYMTWNQTTELLQHVAAQSLHLFLAAMMAVHADTIPRSGTPGTGLQHQSPGCTWERAC